jgi:hypothetical protein
MALRIRILSILACDDISIPKWKYIYLCEYFIFDVSSSNYFILVIQILRNIVVSRRRSPYSMWLANSSMTDTVAWSCLSWAVCHSKYTKKTTIVSDWKPYLQQYTKIIKTPTLQTLHKRPSLLARGDLVSGPKCKHC